jgi:hypothetical protein
MNLPMLDELEFARVANLLHEGLHATMEFRKAHGLPLQGLDVTTRFAPALAEYRRITGYEETNAKALYHHRIALFGPPCTSCGKPLRTPVARHCGACGIRQRSV